MIRLFLMFLPLFLAVCAGAAQAQPKSFRDCPDCPEMVTIPAGAFSMGSSAREQEREGAPPQERDATGPEHVVTIARSFSLGKYEVTRGELKLFVAATGYKLPTSCWTYNAERKWTEILGRTWLKPGFEQTDRDPAVCITWNDAMAYVGWLARTTGKAYRLPSEAEWEYAARAGSKSSRFWGDSRDGACLYGNFSDLTAAAAFKTEPRHEVVFYCSDGVVYTAPVGSFQPNAFGLYDMLGNVWEWTADCVNWRYVLAPTDGSAWLSGDCKSHVLRGGSWNDDPWAARSAVRSNALALLGSANLGFRVARSD